MVCYDCYVIFTVCPLTSTVARASIRNFSTNTLPWPRTLASSTQNHPSSSILLASLIVPSITYVGLRMKWAGYLWCSAQWVETARQPCSTAWWQPGSSNWQQQRGQAMATGLMSSTPACGVTAGRNHTGLLSSRPSCSVRLEHAPKRLWSVAERSEIRITAPTDLRKAIKESA